MATMREIKRRKESIQSTQQITKAMKLVSTVKLQKAKGRAESSKPYFDLMYKTVTSILAKSGNIQHPYLTANDSPKKAIITVTSNRGLAGGYNSNHYIVSFSYCCCLCCNLASKINQKTSILQVILSDTSR